MPAILDLPAFDALDCAQRLRAADVPEKQAEALAEILRGAFAGQGARQQEIAAQAAQQVALEADSKTAQAILTLKNHTDARHAETQQSILALKNHMDAGFAEARRETDAQIAEARRETDAQIAEVRREMDTGFAEVRREMDAGFAEVRREMDARHAETHKLILQLAANMDTRHAETQQSILQLRAEMQEQFAQDRRKTDARFARQTSQLRLHNWMLGILVSIAIAVALKIFL